MSSVSTARGGAVAVAARERARLARAAARRGRPRSAALSAAIRWPETNSTRSHQCEPMSAKAREAPPSSGSTRQLSSDGAEQPVLQVAAVEQAQVAERAGADPRARLAHGRVVAVDERHRRDPAGALGGARRARRRRRRRARAASRRRRACRPRARRGRSGRCRWLGVQTWTTSIVVGGDQLLGAGEGALGAELARRASRALSGEEAATPASRAPASRAERAWTRPMKPVPTIPARSSAVAAGALRRPPGRPRWSLSHSPRREPIPLMYACQAKVCRWT